VSLEFEQEIKAFYVNGRAIQQHLHDIYAVLGTQAGIAK